MSGGPLAARAVSKSWRRGMPHSPWVWFWLALLVLCPVNWLSVYCDPWFWSPPKPVGDGPDYENIGFHLSIGEGFVFDNTHPVWRSIYSERAGEYAAQLNAAPRNLSATGRPPLLPLIIASVYLVAGRSAMAFAAVRVMLATCLAIGGALSVWLTNRLLSHSASRVVVLIGCSTTLLLAATNRTLRSYSSDFLTEPLALLLAELFLCCVISMTGNARPAVSQVARDPRGEDDVPIASPIRSRRWLPVLAGVFLGAMILTRSMFVLWLPGIWLLTVASQSGGLVSRLRIATQVLLAAGCVCLPWWLHNVVVLGRFMPLGTQGPIALLGGYSDAALNGDGDWRIEPEQRLRAELESTPAFRNAVSDTVREIVVAAAARERVREWTWQHLADLPLLFAKRVYVHWNPYTGRSLLWKIAIVMGAVGLLVRRDRAACWMLGLPLLSTLTVAGLYSVGGRFLVPWYGLLFTLGGLGLAWLTTIVVGKRNTA